MKTPALLAFASLLLALPGLAAAPGDVVGQGHIAVGTPLTGFITDDVTGIQNFFLPLSGQAAVATATVDNSGLGYDLDLHFYTADMTYISGCATNDADETCSVPAGAALVEVAAFSGIDLDVTVVEV